MITKEVTNKQETQHHKKQ